MRIGWLVNCCACACSAGVLCAVLWTRFVQVPTIMSLQAGEVTGAVPSMAVCRTPAAAAADVSRHLANSSMTSAITSLLRGRAAPEYQLYYVDYLLRTNNLTLSKLLNRGMNCSKVFNAIDGAGWVKSNSVWAGFGYKASMSFHLILGYDDGVNLVDSGCDSTDKYSRTVCRASCAEKACGCSDPMLSYDDDARVTDLPPCSVAHTMCLRTYDLAKCDCLPACRQLQTSIAFKQIPLGAEKYALDSLYSGFDTNHSIAMNIKIKTVGSHVLARLPTETWLTLLSSLGGVFSMFLGVSLFSAIELLYFLLVRVPIAIRRSPEIELPSAAPVRPRRGRPHLIT